MDLSFKNIANSNVFNFDGFNLTRLPIEYSIINTSTLHV